jgi:hypothetical protein
MVSMRRKIRFRAYIRHDRKGNENNKTVKKIGIWIFLFQRNIVLIDSVTDVRAELDKGGCKFNNSTTAIASDLRFSSIEREDRWTLVSPIMCKMKAFGTLSFMEYSEF